MKRNQNGVTLIALVVTIVVMLILAATALAMLSGDSGIVTNAQKARAANTESTVVEKLGMAYNAVKQEATIKMATEVGYRPVQNADKLLETAYLEISKDIITKETQSNGSAPSVATAGSANTTTGYIAYLEECPDTATEKYIDIVIVYRDSTFDLASISTTASEGTYPADNQYPQLEARIRLTTGGVSYIDPVRSTLI